MFSAGSPPRGTLLAAGSTGAGKTTTVPLALLEQFERSYGTSGKILLLPAQARLGFPKAAAQRLAAGLNEAVWKPGWLQGAAESTCCSATTRIEVIHRRVCSCFLRRLAGRFPLLRRGCVIFDEFSRNAEAKRNSPSCCCRERDPLLAPELRLLLMSATHRFWPLALPTSLRS